MPTGDQLKQAVETEAAKPTPDNGKVADNYYAAAHAYTEEGATANAEAMRKKAREALDKIDSGPLDDRASIGEGKAVTEEERARKKSDGGETEGPHGSTEEYTRAGERREQVGDCWAIIAGREHNTPTGGPTHRKAAKEYVRAAEDFERAADDEPDTPKQQKEAKAEFARAAALRRQAAEQHRQAADAFKKQGDLKGEAREKAAAAAQDIHAREDDVKSK